jgi:hypothetical protein
MLILPLSAWAVGQPNALPTGLPTISGAAVEDQTLTAVTSAIDDLDGLGAFSYQWLRDGSNIAGATNATYTLTDADVGTVIRVRVRWTDGRGNAETLLSAGTSTVTNVNDLPLGLPAIAGTPTEDQVLSAVTSGISDLDGLGAFSYQWLRNGGNVAGATGVTYTLGDADVGANISVRVSYTDAAGAAESTVSPQVGPVANVNDPATGAPSIAGTARQASVLTASPGTLADIDGMGTISYQWLRNGIPISGAAASTYTLQSADVGALISVRASFTDARGSAETATSGTVGPVLAVVEASLVILKGQSNAKGWSQDAQNTTAMTGGYGYEYRDAADGGGAFLPLGRTLLGRTQGGLQSAFAQAWASGGGGACLFVDVSVNGSSMIDAAKGAQTGNAATQGYESLGAGTWDLGANSLYTQANGAKSQIDKAIAAATAAGFSIAKKVVIWVQGEQDAQANATSADYTPRLVALIDRLVSDYSIDAFLIASLGVASASPPAAWADIRSGQTAAAAARSSVATVAFTDTPNFFAAGKNIAGDSLHYTQQGYNEMGAGLATAGLAFLGGLSIAIPPAAVYDTIRNNPPALARWKRMLVTTTRSGAISPQVYGGGNTPISFTFVDTSGANRMQGGNPSWSYPSTAAKVLCLYMTDQVGAPTIVDGGNLLASAVAIPDAGFKCGAFNFGSGGNAAGLSFPEADMLRIDAAALSFFAVNGTDPDNTVAITDAVLSRFTGLTQVRAPRSDTLAAVNWGLRNGLTYIGLQQIGYSVAEVNQVLQTVDAMGTSGAKTLDIGQYRASPALAAAPPSGAGATAKANLISRGWTVNTD